MKQVHTLEVYEVAADVESMSEEVILKRQEELNGPLDGADIISVLITCADELGFAGLEEFLDTRLAQDLINNTQSNTEQAWELIREWARLDEELARRGDEMVEEAMSRDYIE